MRMIYLRHAGPDISSCLYVCLFRNEAMYVLRILIGAKANRVYRALAAPGQLL